MSTGFQEEVCQSRCNVFCASIINIAVSSELGYGVFVEGKNAVAVVLVASKRVLLRLGRASKAVTLLLHPRLWSADTKGIRHLRIYSNRNERGQAKTNGTRSEGETSKTRCESLEPRVSATMR